MPPFIQGRLSAFIAIAACLVLLLLSKIFTESDVSVNTQATFGDRAAAPAALAKREVEAPATIVAVPFGNKAGLQLSPPKAKSFLPSSNVKRDDVNVLWSNAIQSGIAQLDRLNKGIRTDSPARDVNDMVGPAGAAEGYGNGWDVDDIINEPDVPEGYLPVYEDLKISQGTADNHYRLAAQTLAFSNCFGNNLKPTGGTFRDMVNVRSGTMVALSSYSPAFKIEKSDPDWKMKLPRVSKMSDVLWIQWVTVAAKVGTPEKVSDLRYIFRHDIATFNTKVIMEQAAAKHEGEPIAEGEFEAEWPGYEFTKADEQFTALLGTIHGKTIVDLIVTHDTGLPGKSIESVTIFSTEGNVDFGEAYHMLWTLKDTEKLRS